MLKRGVSKSVLCRPATRMSQWAHFSVKTTAGRGLYSDQFGTCPGFVVTGTPAPKTHNLPDGGPTKFLFHMSLGSGKTFTEFATAVRNSGMTNLRGTMFTVDTRSTNSENRQPGMAAHAADAETDYHDLEGQLETLCGRTKVDRQYHTWASTGEMGVSSANYVTCA
jgi:hypothetical protein